MDQETVWDGGATTWDRDYAGPGTRTVWDLLPAILGTVVLGIVTMTERGRVALTERGKV